MITEVENHPESSTNLVAGIVDDFRDLVKQELHLAHQELMDDLRQTREAGWFWALGMGLVFLSAITFVLMFVNLIHTMASPVADPASIPMWACCAIVGVLLAVPGICVAMVGQKKFNAVSLLQNQFNRVAKEVSNERSP